MQVIKITEVETASGVKDSQPWSRTDITGKNSKTGNEVKTSTFDYNELAAGDTIEAEIVVQGQYSKLKTFRKIVLPSQTPPAVNKAAVIPPKQPSSQPNNALISGAEKGMILKEVGDSLRAGLFQTKDQPDLWAFYKSEISRVTGVTVK